MQRTKARPRPAGPRFSVAHRPGRTWGDYSAELKKMACFDRLSASEGAPDHELQPSFPDVAEGVGRNIHAQIAAPCGESSVQHPEYADDNNLPPALIAVKQAKHQPLGRHCQSDIPAQRMELALQKSSKRHLLAYSRRNRSRHPKRDLKQTLRQQAVDGFCGV